MAEGEEERAADGDEVLGKCEIAVFGLVWKEWVTKARMR